MVVDEGPRGPSALDACVHLHSFVDSNYRAIGCDICCFPMVVNCPSSLKSTA